MYIVALSSNGEQNSSPFKGIYVILTNFIFVSLYVFCNNALLIIINNKNQLIM